MYFDHGGFHMNLNVIDKETLEDAMKNPGQVPAAHDPGVGLCGQFRPADAGAAAGRDQPHIPRPGLSRERAMAQLGTLEAGSRHDLRVGLSPDAPDEGDRATRSEGAFGYVHSYETSSRYDGPGLRVVLFVSGCLLRCTYCHNPDTWHLKDGTYVSGAAGDRPPRRLRAGAASRSTAA